MISKIFRLVEIEAMDDAETRTKWRGDQSRAGGGADQREMIQVKWMNARAGSLADDKIHAKIFHRGIENFFDSGLQAMNFVEKKNFLGSERSENCGEVAFAFEQRTSAGLDGNVQFVGDDLRESGFAEARRAVQQNVIESFAAIASGFEGDGNIFFDALLADIFVKRFWADAGVEPRVFIVSGAGDDSFRAIGSAGHPCLDRHSFVLRFRPAFFVSELFPLRLNQSAAINCRRQRALRRAQCLQRCFQQFFETGHSDSALPFRDGCLRGASVVAEIGERGDDVGFDACFRRRLLVFGNRDSFEFVFQLDDHALGGLAADAGNSS